MYIHLRIYIRMYVPAHLTGHVGIDSGFRASEREESGGPEVRSCVRALAAAI